MAATLKKKEKREGSLYKRDFYPGQALFLRLLLVDEWLKIHCLYLSFDIAIFRPFRTHLKVILIKIFLIYYVFLVSILGETPLRTIFVFEFFNNVLICYIEKRF